MPKIVYTSHSYHIEEGASCYALSFRAFESGRQEVTLHRPLHPAFGSGED